MNANMVPSTTANPNIILFMLQEILAAPLGGGGGGDEVVVEGGVVEGVVELGGGDGVLGGVPLAAVTLT